MILVKKLLLPALLGAGLMLVGCGSPTATEGAPAAPTATLIVATFEPTEQPPAGGAVITSAEDLATALAAAGYETTTAIQE